MSKTPSQVTAIGFFVLTALVLMVAMLMAFGGNSWFRTAATYTMDFDSSVKGLSAGSPVMFRGVKIGQVSSIQLHPQDSDGSNQELSEEKSFHFPVQVSVEIEPEKLGFPGTTWKQIFSGDVHGNREELRDYLTELVVKQGLRAKLQSVSILTGQLCIELSFDQNRLEQDNPEKIRAEMLAGIFPTQLGFLDQVSNRIGGKNFRNQMESLQKLIAQVSDYVESGQSKQLMDDISVTARNLRSITETLDKQLPAILDESHTVLADAHELVSDGKEQLRTVVNNIIVLTTRIGLAMVSAHQLMGNLNDIATMSKPQINHLLNQFSTTLDEAQLALVDTHAAVQEARDILAPGSPTRQQLEQTLDECQKSLSTLRMLLDNLNRNPQILLLGE
ncbi:MAG: MCE family protein [Victivallales bacterium]|nr:MCE family protein [Victivallales bacterium]